MVLLTTWFARYANDSQAYDGVVVPFLDRMIMQFPVAGYPTDAPTPRRVGADRTDGLVFPENFTPVLAESELAEGQPTRATHDGVPILLVRRGQRLFAMAETCSHFNGPLSEGKLVDGSIECPYHASRFALDDGRVINGPAVHPQPRLEVRIREGQIEVRKAPLGTRRPA